MQLTTLICVRACWRLLETYVPDKQLAALASKAPGLKVRAGRGQARWGAAQLDLAADLVFDGDAVELALEYNADMFHSETAERIAGHFLVRRRPYIKPCAAWLNTAAMPSLHECCERHVG